MMFSARSFSLARSASRAARSCAASAPRAAVPFIGTVRSSPSSQRRKDSGLALTTAVRPRSRKAWWEPCCRWASSPYSPKASPVKRDRRRVVRLHW